MAKRYRKGAIRTMHQHGPEGNPHRHKQAEHDALPSGFRRRRRAQVRRHKRR